MKMAPFVLSASMAAWPGECLIFSNFCSEIKIVNSPQIEYHELAFPQDGDTGMTLRDYFAAKVLYAMIVSGDFDFRTRELRNNALTCYEIADVMVEMRD